MLAKGLQQQLPDAEVLVLQGGLPQKYISLRDGLNVVDVPQPFTVKEWLNGKQQVHVNQIRQRLRFMKQALDNFKPDVFITEFFPFGRMIERYELIPLIQALRRRGTKIVGSAGYPILSGSQDFTERYLVYYDKMLIHAVKELDLDMLKHMVNPAYAAFFEQEKMTFTGYLAEKKVRTHKEEVRKSLGIGERKFVLCSRGGGIILPQILYKTILASKQFPEHYFLVVPGAASSKKELAILEKLAAGRENVRIMPYTNDFFDYLNACDISVNMCGYNTSCELLQLRKKAVVMPLYYSKSGEIEQLYRARLLEKLLGNKTILPEELTTEKLAAALREQDNAPAPQPALKDAWLQGMKTTAEVIAAL